MIKVLILLAMSSLSGGDIVLSQGETEVTVSDVDVLIHSVPVPQRGHLAKNPKGLEKNIFTLLNMNHIYSYAEKEDIEIDFDEQIEVDTAFIDAVSGIKKDEFSQAVNQFEYKKKLFLHLQNKTAADISSDEIKEIAYERYLLDSNAYVTDQKVRLSELKISETEYQSVMSNNDIASMSFDDFIAQLVKTQGNERKADDLDIGWFSQNALPYSFLKEVVFKEGLTTKPVEHNGAYYIHFVSEFTPSRKMSFEEVREQIEAPIRKMLAQKRFQGIIDQQTVGQDLEVNPEVVSQLFQRYGAVQ